MIARRTVLALFAILPLSGAIPALADENTMIITLKDGPVTVQLRPDLAPKHVERIKQLVIEGAYNGVVWHRVIPGFMAQTGDVEFGNTLKNFDATRAGTGGSPLPDLPAEFTTAETFQRGTVGMARGMMPDSANAQFFIMFEAAPHLDGQYTIVGQVTEGMEFVDNIKKGQDPVNGMVTDPDVMVSVTLAGN
ncbi:MAG: peptidylprolyl isomerase [Rhizobiaceae bacterium]|nr:peptidylprolyl isomerase [Rhizobiaceae bacterium]